MPKFFEPQTIQPSHSEPVFEHQQYEEEEFTPKMSEAVEIRTLLSWEAPSRPYRSKDRSYYTTIAILVILIALIAFMAKEILLIAVVFSLAFVAYVLGFIPPGDVKYKVSTQGITIGDQFYFWHTLDSFWFREREGQKVLFIQTRLKFPGQLMLVLGSQDEEEIKKEVAKFLPYSEKPQTSLIERWAEGLQKHFPLENTHR